MNQSSTEHHQRTWLRQALLLSLLLLGSLFMPQRAEAATFVVNSFVDTVDANLGDPACKDAAGNCSLRAAIMQANATPGKDTIMLPAGTYTLSIPHQFDDVAIVEADDSSGDLDIHDDLEIIGDGPALTIIQGAVGLKDKIISINPRLIQAFFLGEDLNKVPAISVTLTGFTIQNGTTEEGYGAGGDGAGMDYFARNGSTLLLEDLVIQHNTNPYGRGGGIALHGMPGHSPAPAVLRNVTIQDNHAQNWQGGGLYVGGDLPVHIYNSRITENRSLLAGGGLCLAPGAGTVLIVDSLVASNQVLNSQDDGGGIYTARSLTIDRSTISANKSNQNGGGLYALLQFGHNLAFESTTFSGNEAADDGGGLYLERHATQSSTVTLTNLTVTANKVGASGDGGGILIKEGQGNVRLRNSIVAQNLKGTSTANDISGDLQLGTASTHNLIGTGGAGGLTNGTQSNQVGVTNPGLAPLADNGGGVPTHALLAGSPALDAGFNGHVTSATDARGVTRILDAADADATRTVDIGAYEAHPTIQQIAPQTMVQDTTLLVTFHVGDGIKGFDAIAVTSTNTDLVPDENLEVPDAPGASTRTLHITPAPGEHGSTSITVTLTDGASSASTTFPLTVAGLPDLIVTKAPTIAQNWAQGESGAYRIIVTNAGGSATSGEVVVTESPPPKMVATSLVGTDWNCTLVDLTCRRSDPLAGGASYPEITMQVSIAPDAPPLLTNSVTVSGGGESNTDNNEATHQAAITQLPDLVVRKLATTLRQGETNASYQILVENTGQGQTQGLMTVTNTLPLGLTPTAATAPTEDGWSCSVDEAARTITCTRSLPLAANESSTITVTLTISPTAGASLVNPVTITGGGEQVGYTSNNTDNSLTAITPMPNLTVTVESVGTFKQGEDAAYKLTVKNVGSAPTTGTINLAATLGAGLQLNWSYVAGAWDCRPSHQHILCTSTDPLIPGGSAEIYLDISVLGTTAQLDAEVSGGGEIYTADSKVIGHTTPVIPAPVLQITMTHTDPFVQGQVGASYQIGVTNPGPTPTSGRVEVVDQLPPGLTATAISGPGWSCSLTPLKCWRNDALPGNASYADIALVVNVAQEALATVTNRAFVTGGGQLTEPTVADLTNITQLPDLVVVAQPATYQQGQRAVSYSLRVDNVGTGTTTGMVNLVATLPAGLTPIAGGDCTVDALNPQRLNCSTPATIAAKAGRDFTLTFDVATTAEDGLIGLQVSGGGEQPDRVGNNDAHPAITITPMPDLAIQLAPVGTFRQGRTGQVLLTVANAGGAATTDPITLTVTLSEGLTLKQFLAGEDWGCTDLTCTRTTALAKDATETIRLDLEVGANATSVTAAAALSGGGEIYLANSAASEAIPVVPAPDLTLALTRVGEPTQGAQHTYSLFVTNSGQGPTFEPIALNLALSPGLTNPTVSGSGWYCEGLICSTSATLAPSQSTLPLVLTVDLPADAPPDPVTVSAAVSGGGELDASNNSATNSAGVRQLVDLRITQSQSAAFTQGQVGATYTLTVTNHGLQANTLPVSVTIADQPTWLQVTEMAGTGWVWDGQRTATHAAGLTPGVGYALTVTVSVDPDAPATVANTATVAGGGDTSPANNSTTAQLAVEQLANLTFLPSPTHTFQQGQQAAPYTITLLNKGRGASQGEISVTFTLPTGFQAVDLQGDGWSCDLDELTCTRNDSLAPGEEATAITLKVDVPVDAPELVHLVAQVAGGGQVITQDDQSTFPTDVRGVADLILKKSHVGRFPKRSVSSYTLLVTNRGTGATVGEVSVVDRLPAGLKAVSMTGQGWSCTLATLTCTRTDALAPGGSYPPISLRVEVANDAPNQVINEAQVYGGGQANLTNDLALDPTEIAPAQSSTPPPYVTIAAPVAVTREATITVSGSANPGASVSVGGSVVTASAGGTWSAQVSLHEGSNLITATNSYVSDSVTVIRDTVPPPISLVASELVTEAEHVMLTATSEEGARITIEGQVRTTLWVPLAPGSNSFTASATDRAGNSASTTVTVVRRIPLPKADEVIVKPGAPALVETEAVRVELPSNSGTQTLQLVIEAPQRTALPGIRPGLVAVAAEIDAYVLPARDPVHQLPATIRITFTYDPALVTDPQSLRIFYYDPVRTAWIQLGGQVDPTAHTITVEVDHLTLFAVLMGVSAPTIDPLPAGVATQSLPVTGRATPGAQVTLLVNGKAQAAAKADASGRFQLTATLTAGQNRLWVKDEAGLASAERELLYLDLTQPGPKRPTFSDLVGHWAESGVAAMVDLGVVKGYEDNTFRPEAQVSRLEFAVMLARLLNLAPVSDPLPFVDQGKIPEWGRGAVGAAVRAGLITGRPDGTFDPDGQITRAEIAVMLVRALKLRGYETAPGAASFTDPLPAWAEAQVLAAARYGLVTGYQDGTFRPERSATRAEAVTMLARLLQAISR